MRRDEEPDEVDVDGHIDSRGVQYFGKAKWVRPGTYIALADVNGCLCRVEAKLRQRC